MDRNMAFWSWKKKEKRDEGGVNVVSLVGNPQRFTEGKSVELSTVYRCVSCISDAVAQLPIEILKVTSKGYKKRALTHPAFWLVNKEPSRHMSRFTMMKSLVTSMILKGNGYIRIARNEDGNAIELEFLHPDNVAIIDDEYGHIAYYAHPRYGFIEPSDIIHIVNFSHDGEHGVSTVRYAANTLGLAYDSEVHAREFFKGGASLSGVVSVNHPLTAKQKEDFFRTWSSKFNSAGRGGVALMEADMEYKPISVSPSDAQLLETRQFNVVDICRFFGVSPSKAYDLSHSSYSSIEASQLAFLTDTLQPILDKIELEFERKLFLPGERFKYDVSFDTSVLLRTDKSALADYYTKMFNLGVLTSNEIRRQMDFEPVEGGDQPFIQSNLVPIDKPMNATLAQQQPNPGKNGSNNQEEDDETQL